MEGDNVNIIMKREKDSLGEPPWPVDALLFSVCPACRAWLPVQAVDVISLSKSMEVL